MKEVHTHEIAMIFKQRRELEIINESHREAIIAIDAEIKMLSNTIVKKRNKKIELENNIRANNDLFYNLGEKLRKSEQ